MSCMVCIAFGGDQVNLYGLYCPRGTLLLGYVMGRDPCPTSVVTTHNAIGLLVQ
jgi:hypothetical protein